MRSQGLDLDGDALVLVGDLLERYIHEKGEDSSEQLLDYLLTMYDVVW